MLAIIKVKKELWNEEVPYCIVCMLMHLQD